MSVVNFEFISGHYGADGCSSDVRADERFVGRLGWFGDGSGALHEPRSPFPGLR